MGVLPTITPPNLAYILRQSIKANISVKHYSVRHWDSHRGSI